MIHTKKIKDKIRSQMLARRNALSREDRQHLSALVCQHLNELVEKSAVNTIHSFIPFQSEIDIKPFLKHCLDLKLQLIVPRLHHKPVMEHILIENLDDLVENKFGIKEPSGGSQFKEDIDIIIVPGIAFAKDGYRIGYGGGYYDYFLANQKKALKIGVGFPFQLIDYFPFVEHDIPVDILYLGEMVVHPKL